MASPRAWGERAPTSSARRRGRPRSASTAPKWPTRSGGEVVWSVPAACSGSAVAGLAAVDVSLSALPFDDPQAARVYLTLSCASRSAPCVVEARGLAPVPAGSGLSERLDQASRDSVRVEVEWTYCGDDAPTRQSHRLQLAPVREGA